MSFDLFVKEAQPCLAVVEDEATEGRSWDFTYAVEHVDGSPVDLSGVTAQARVFSAVDGSVLLTFACTVGGVGNNEVTLTAAPAATATVGGGSLIPKSYPWHLTLTNGAGRKGDVFGSQESRLLVFQGV